MNPDSIGDAKDTPLGKPRPSSISSALTDLDSAPTIGDGSDVSLSGLTCVSNNSKNEPEEMAVGLPQSVDRGFDLTDSIIRSSEHFENVDGDGHCNKPSCVEKEIIEPPMPSTTGTTELQPELPVQSIIIEPLQSTAVVMTEEPSYFYTTLISDEKTISGQSEVDDRISVIVVKNNEERINPAPVSVPSEISDCVEVSTDVLTVTADTPANETPSRPMSREQNLEPVYKFENNVREITGSWNEFQSKKGECFTKGCKWAPDGTCILTNSEDNVLRIFDLPPELHCQESWPASRSLPEMKPVLKMAERGLIYDYCWYPLMSSWNPLSCCLVSTSQYSPIHLWDAFTGELRATYRPYNQMDEVVSANCVAFDRIGDKLYCGFNNVVRVFNTAVPGRQCDTRSLKSITVAVESQRGLVSCISVNPEMQKIYAVGTYLKSIGLYSEPDGSPLCLLEAHMGGVSHLTFSPDGTKLFSGGRKDPEIICWDVRNPGSVLYVLQRQAATNQRIYFDICPDGRYLLSGNSDGMVKVWDLLEPPESSSSQDSILPPLKTFKAHDDCVNGLSIHQQYSILATSSGQRHFAEVSLDSESDSDGSNSPILKRKYIRKENSVKLWWIGNTAL